MHTQQLIRSKETRLGKRERERERERVRHGKKRKWSAPVFSGRETEGKQDTGWKRRRTERWMGFF